MWRLNLLIMRYALSRLLFVVLPFYAVNLACSAGEPEQRIKDLTELAEKGDGPSQFKLALAYDETGNSQLAVVWLRKAAERGYVQAASELGVKLIMGGGVPIDEKQAVKWFRMAADHGDAPAQYDLASCYVSGKGVSRNLEKAAQWGRVSAEQHYPDAEYMMGVLYGRGDGVSQDYVKSFEWVSMAAAHGHVQAKQSIETLKGVMTPAQIARAGEAR